MNWICVCLCVGKSVGVGVSSTHYVGQILCYLFDCIFISSCTAIKDKSRKKMVLYVVSLNS